MSEHSESWASATLTMSTFAADTLRKYPTIARRSARQAAAMPSRFSKDGPRLLQRLGSRPLQSSVVIGAERHHPLAEPNESH